MKKSRHSTGIFSTTIPRSPLLPLSGENDDQQDGKKGKMNLMWDQMPRKREFLLLIPRC